MNLKWLIDCPGVDGSLHVLQSTVEIIAAPILNVAKGLLFLIIQPAPTIEPVDNSSLSAVPAPSGNQGPSFLENATDLEINGGEFNNVCRDLVKILVNPAVDANGDSEIPTVPRSRITLKAELCRGQGYRYHLADMLGEEHRIIVKVFEGPDPAKLFTVTKSFSQALWHPNLLQVRGVSSGDSKTLHIVYRGYSDITAFRDSSASLGRFEFLLASALRKDSIQSIRLGSKAICGLSAGIDHLSHQDVPVALLGTESFDFFVGDGDNVVIAFNPNISENDENSKNSDPEYFRPGGLGEWVIFNGLCHKVFTASNKIAHDCQRHEANDTLSTIYDHEDDRFEELDDLDTQSSGLQDAAREQPSQTMPASTAPFRPSTAEPMLIAASLREFTWRTRERNNLTLDQISQQYRALEDASQKASKPTLHFSRSMPRVSSTPHRCPGYNREEISLSTDISKSVIVSHATPRVYEICSVCEQAVGVAETFRCVCGKPDDGTMHTKKCSSCSTYHHSECFNGQGTCSRDGITNDTSESDAIILIVGLTGVGKSTFINIAAGAATASIGHDLKPCTTEIQAFAVRYPGDPTRSVILVDTPGFNDTWNGDKEVLRHIVDWLKLAYERGMKLAGIMYLHDISQARIEPVKENLEMFNSLCRPSAVKNVILASTKWSGISADTGLRREQQLSQYWTGPDIMRFDDTLLSAWAIINVILKKPPMDALLVQKELANVLERLVPQAKASNSRGFFTFFFGRRRPPVPKG